MHNILSFLGFIFANLPKIRENLSRENFYHYHMTFDQVVLLNHVTIWKMYISILTSLIATKLGSVLTPERRFSM